MNFSADSPLAPALLVALAYLLGSIPFGYLIARAFGKFDIRTLGSGNIGATNVGRVLGFKFFVVVFLLDFAKGFLPTRFLPGLLGDLGRWSDLPVALAVAAILGHNFPVFLRFRGGKGVATSLGAVWALDAWASVAAAGCFALLLAAFRYVSVSSLAGGLAWLAVHFARTDRPWGRSEIALSVASIGLMALLIVRHRKNLARLADGTEPKVQFRRPKGDANDPRRPGRAGVRWVIGLAALGVATASAASIYRARAGRKAEVAVGPWLVEEVSRASTGHQRVERVCFADSGRILAATCPRYGRLMVYRVDPDDRLALAADVDLGGRPVAVAAGPDALYALVRPTNDARHVQEGWWQSFDLLGRPTSPRHRAGMYPDDLAVIDGPDLPGQRLLVLSSGRGEGDASRPPASVASYRIDPAGGTPEEVGRASFDRPGDDPGRLAIRPDGKMAAVSIVGPTSSVAWVSLADPDHPSVVARTDWPRTSRPDALRFGLDGTLLATDEADDLTWRQAGPDRPATSEPLEGGGGDVVEFGVEAPARVRAMSLPFDSAVGFALVAGPKGSDMSRLPILGGRTGLATTRPVGLAAEPGRGLIAVGNWSGGSVHLLRVRPRDPVAP